MSEPKTLLAVLAHPDDEVVAAGTLMAQRARGDRVVVLWLTRGEMTQAFGDLPTETVAAKREELGRKAADILDVEPQFLRLKDTGIQATPQDSAKVARFIAQFRPDGILTWGDAWTRGPRHPDHQATGEIARNAVTLARIAKVLEIQRPHRAPCPVFTYRGVHSRLPWVAVDVEPYLDRIFEVASLYRDAIGFGDPEWLESRLRKGGELAGVEHAEVFDAWETGGGIVETLLPPKDGDALYHPNWEHRDSTDPPPS